MFKGVDEPIMIFFSDFSYLPPMVQLMFYLFGFYIFIAIFG